MILKVLIKLIKIINAFFYKCMIPKMKINILRSHFSGSVMVKDGSLTIKDGFRTKKSININVNGGDVLIDENVFFNNGVSINCMCKITIGKNSIFGEGVKVYDHDHDFTKGNVKKRTEFKMEGVCIGENVWIGSNVVVLKGVTIGNNSIISAGTIVNKNVPQNMILIQKRKNDLRPIEYE